MFIKYRWYQIQFPSSDFDLSSILVDCLLTKNTSFGFLHIDGAMGNSMFRFLLRTKVIVTLFDDEGTPSYEEVASVNFTDFAIVTIKGITFLRIENPGRNIRDLLNTLESLIGLGFTSKPLTFEKVKPTTAFESVKGTKLIGLKVNGAVIDEDLVARMEFTSKKGMNIEDMKLLDRLNYKVVFAEFELIYKGVRGRVALASSGLVTVSGQLAPRLVYLIERDLPRLM